MKRFFLACLFLAAFAGCSNPDGLMYQGNLAYRKGEFTRAAELFEKAREHPTVRGAASYNLGRLYFEQGRFQEAEELLREAGELEVKHPMVKVYLARNLAALGRTEEAEAELRRTLKIHPDLSQAQLSLGRLLVAKGELEEASSFLKELEKDPKLREQVSLLSAEISAKRGDPGAAVKTLQTYLSQSPLSASAHFALASLLADQGRTEDSERHLRTAGMLDPTRKQQKFPSDPGKIE
jgi:tetratricopeptide (TPR) repeat protein